MAVDSRKDTDLHLGERQIRESLTREQLYELVWSEPMLKIAARFDVSSSYMARVCTQLNVPRPQKGYWAKLEVGKAPEKPLLPEARPGDELVWRNGGDGSPVSKPSPKPPNPTAKKLAIPSLKPRSAHPLIDGAKGLFEAGRLSYDSNYLKPAKKLLIDLAVTKAGLDKALSFANHLYLALEAAGHRVVIAPQSEHFGREAVDEREEQTRNRGYSNLWAPARSTVVYLGTVAIGLTIIEMSEEVTVRYVNGKYIPESEYIPPKRGRYTADHTWTTKKDFGSGRLCLQAYSPYSRTKWVQQWRETKGGDLVGRIPTIVRDLERASPEVARLFEEGQRQAELEMRKWEEQRELWRKEEAERRSAQALKESKEALIQIINDWAESTRIDQFFTEMEARAALLGQDDRQVILERLKQARQLLKGSDSIGRLKGWKTPGIP